MTASPRAARAYEGWFAVAPSQDAWLWAAWWTAEPRDDGWTSPDVTGIGSTREVAFADAESAIRMVRGYGAWVKLINERFISPPEPSAPSDSSRRRGEKPSRGDLPYVDAREGPNKVDSSVSQFRWVPKHVWTLHVVPGRPHGPPLAVRRRVLRNDSHYLEFEIARRETTVRTHKYREDADSRPSLGEDGIGRTDGHVDWIEKEERVSAEVHAWVYDHNPTDADRKAWLKQHTIEQRAIRKPPSVVWVISEDGSIFTRARATRVLGRYCGASVYRFSLEAEIQLKKGAEPKTESVDMLDLVSNGNAKSFWGSWIFFLSKPTDDVYRSIVNKYQQKKAEQTKSKADAEAFASAFVNAFRPQPKPDPLAAFGLKPPCTAADVNKAFRKAVVDQKAHPDQGGSAEAFQRLTRARDAAIAAVGAL